MVYKNLTSSEKTEVSRSFPKSSLPSCSIGPKFNHCLVSNYYQKEENQGMKYVRGNHRTRVNLFQSKNEWS